MKLIYYYSIVIVSSLCVSFAAGWVIKKGLQKSGVHFYDKMNAARDINNKTEIILAGSSRTLYQLNPKVIDSVTGLNSFNFGLNAASIKTSCNVIRYAIQHLSSSKLVVLNIDYSMFAVDKDPYKDPYYYPYENDTAAFIMNNTGQMNTLHKLKLFDISLYDDYVKYAGIDGLLRPRRKQPGEYKGFLPHYELHDFEAPGLDFLYKRNIPVSEKGFELLKTIIDLCKQNNKQLVLVLAPYANTYFPTKYIDNYYDIINNTDSIALQNNIPFFKYTNLPFANDNGYFYNTNHMNIRGADIYSKMLAIDIANYLRAQ